MEITGNALDLLSPCKEKLTSGQINTPTQA